ncbi:hypothetical protein I7I48_08833 [Histoplasma ohiense]|nr:hypothetical protein I7I48_08833 [Histoplasma ohiense (nom. inval.)]
MEEMRRLVDLGLGVALRQKRIWRLLKPCRLSKYKSKRTDENSFQNQITAVQQQFPEWRRHTLRLLDRAN